MDDHEKTQEQLIRELQDLRNQIAVSEDTSGPDGGEESAESLSSRSTRNAIQVPITFIGDFTLVQAQGIDLSEGGIRFEVSEDLPFEMEFEIEGEVHQHRAHLVWMKRLEGGGSQWGFQFAPSDSWFMLDAYKSLTE